MAFNQGKSGNPKGRPKGTKNRATSELVERISKVLEKNAKRLQDDLDSLQPVERIRAITGLVGYVIPKKQALNVQQSLDYEYHKLEELLKSAPDEAVEKILQRIQKLREKEAADGEQQ